MAISRSFAIEYEQYVSHRSTPLNREDLELKEYFGANIPALIPGADLTNHRFSKMSDYDTQFGFAIEYEEGQLIYQVTGTYK